jgi:hypothetical protein
LEQEAEALEAVNLLDPLASKVATAPAGQMDVFLTLAAEHVPPEQQCLDQREPRSCRGDV